MKKYRWKKIQVYMLAVCTFACLSVSSVEIFAQPLNSGGKGYYESQLNEEAAFLVQVFEEHIEDTYNGTNKIEIQVPSGMISENGMDAAFQYAVDAFRLDHPEVFWIDFSKVLLSYDTMSGWVTSLSLGPIWGRSDYYVPAYVDDVLLNGNSIANFGGDAPYHGVESVREAIADVEWETQQCLSTISELATDYQKVVAIHDWLTDHIVYDYNYFDQGLYAALFYGKGVCAGYVTAFHYIANQAGLKTIEVSGVGHSRPTQSENHAWNLVYLDGMWYNLDVTWDDSKEDGNPYYDFFLAGTQTVSERLNGRTFEQTHEIHNYSSLPAFTFELPNISAVSYAVHLNSAGVELGDVNLDGMVDLLDVQLALRAFLELERISGERFVAADVNGNSSLELQDVQMILQKVLDMLTF